MPRIAYAVLALVCATSYADSNCGGREAAHALNMLLTSKLLPYLEDSYRSDKYETIILSDYAAEVESYQNVFSACGLEQAYDTNYGLIEVYITTIARNIRQAADSTKEEKKQLTGLLSALHVSTEAKKYLDTIAK